MKKQKRGLKILTFGLASLALPLSMIGLTLPQSSTSANNDYYSAPVSITNGSFNSISGTYDEGDTTGWTLKYGSKGAKAMIMDVENNYTYNSSNVYYLRENPGKYGKDNKILMINSANASPSSDAFQPTDVNEGYISNEITLSANSYYEFVVAVKTATFNDSTEYASIYISGLEDNNGEQVELSQTKITSRDWERQYFYIATGTESQTITIDLWLGTEELGSNGAVFFDEVMGTQFSENAYYDALNLNSSENVKQIDKSVFDKQTIVDTTNLNFNFEDQRSETEVGNLYAWKIKESSNNANARILEMNESFFENTTGLTYPGTDMTNNNTKSMVLWTNEEGYIRVESLPFEIKALGLYKITLRVKFTELESGSFYAQINETEKIKEDFDYLSTYTPKTETSSALSENGSNSYINGYNELTFYIQGHSRYDSEVTLSLLLGNSSELAKGGVVVDNVVLEQIAFEDFSADENSLQLSTTGEDESIENGYFTNGQPTDSNLTYPISPSSFEISQSSSNHKKLSGIINVYDEYFNEYKTNFAWAENLANPASPNGKTDDVNNILMMFNEAPDWQSITSSTFDLTANNYFNFTFDYKTLADTTFNIKLTDEDGIVILYEKGIRSNGVWKTYSKLIYAGESSSSVTATIELGTENSLTSGYAFFDNMENLSSTKELFDIASSKVDLSGFMLSLDPNNEIDFTLRDANAFKGAIESGSAGTAIGGIIKGEGNDSYGYRGHDSIDDGSLQNKNVLVIESHDNATYSLTSKFTLNLEADNFYVLKFRLLTSMPDEFKYTDSEGNEHLSSFGVSVGLDSYNLITQLKSNDGWSNYEIYFSASEAVESKFVFKLVSDKLTEPCYAYVTDLSFETTDETTYNNIENSKYFGTTIYRATETAEDTETPEEDNTQTDTTEEPNNDYIWLLIPSLIFGVTIILAVILFFLQKFKWNKKEKIGKDKYDRELSLHQDILANEAKAVRDAEIKSTQNHIASLQSQINDIENENKQTAIKAREEGKVTKEVQRKFKSYIQKRTKLQKTIEELNEHLSFIQSPDYLLIIEKRIIADKRRTASLNQKKKKAEDKQSKQTKSKQ